LKSQDSDILAFSIYEIKKRKKKHKNCPRWLFFLSTTAVFLYYQIQKSITLIFYRMASNSASPSITLHGLIRLFAFDWTTLIIHNKIIARVHNLTEMLVDVTAHAEIQAITATASFLGENI
jgi:hypothetical protein